MNNPKQLTFPWSKINKSLLEEFYFEESNLAVKDALLRDDDLFLYGISQTGKTFLLQSVCNYYSSKDKLSLYVPLKEAQNYGSKILDSLDQLNLICIDDIELVARNKEWEIALFNLINSCLDSDCRIIFCSSQNPSSIEFELLDLTSRIKKIDHIELMSVKSRNLPKAIKFIADIRSINLGENEIKYLITYSKRSISELISIINKLDDLSMQLKRRITIPLIKKLFGN